MFGGKKVWSHFSLFSTFQNSKPYEWSMKVVTLLSDPENIRETDLNGKSLGITGLSRVGLMHDWLASHMITFWNDK